MKAESRQLFHIGISFFTVPGISVTKEASLAFQKALNDSGIEFTKTQSFSDRIIVERETPSQLQISAIAHQQPIGQLIAIAPKPRSTFEIFIQEAEAVCSAYEAAWPSPARQVVAADATIRELHETTSEHAFKELWEGRLSQNSNSLEIFDKPIRGGGLRLVMEPKPDEIDPIQVEVKIESFLENTNKIFLETQFRWVKQTPPGNGYGVREKLTLMNDYITGRVHKFLAGGNNDD